MSDSTLLEELLREQHTLSAVERFSRVHDRLTDRTGSFTQLLPASPPSPGQQYAFAVNLDLCTGCKACVTACHSLNGLDPVENWRDTGLLRSLTPDQPYQQTVTTACHHCLDPACLNGCPVQAYEKDASTGVVRHLDDQCIGCQYCVLKCPYDVPKYSEHRGIVRKCDLCSQRLAVGEAPACVQACPSSAITIQLVDRHPPKPGPAETMLPGAFPSDYTQPTTRYFSERPIPPDALPADAGAHRLESAHFPLVVMLVLTQLAAGMFAFLPFLVSLLSPQALLALAFCAFLALHAGLAASVLHLGRPLGAWRFFLGLRTSWMSREILAFGAFSGSATLTLAAAIGALEPALKLPFPAVFKTLGPHLLLFSSASALLGVLSVGASAMIYIDTRRPAWSAGPTSVRFFGSLLLLGASTTATLLSGLAAAGIAIPAIPALIAVAMVVRLGLWMWETQRNTRLLRAPGHPAHGTVRLLRKYYPWAPRLRLLLVLGATTLALASLPAAPKLAAALQALSLLFTLCAQLLDRTLFFTTAAAPRMPGRP